MFTNNLPIYYVFNIIYNIYEFKDHKCVLNVRNKSGLYKLQSKDVE